MSELEKRVVEVVPVPTVLRDLGVRIGKDEQSGMAVVLIPDEVRKQMNVINPVSSFAQADPNWTPGISVVKLDQDLHTYFVAGKRGLNKQALETLAKAAGVLYTRTARVPNGELGQGELWAYRATVGFRRSDGTIDEVTRERGFDERAERDEIEKAVTNAKVGDEGDQRPKFGEIDSPAWKAEVEKRWLNELRFGRAKTESKAINRALRAGLQVPTSLKKSEIDKPFLVIGYNFTPDYDDVEVKRILVAAGLNAQAAIYGASAAALETATPDVEGTAAKATSPDGGEVEETATPTDGREPSVEPEAAAEQAGEEKPKQDREQEPPPAEASPAPRDGEPPLETEEFKPPKAAVDKAGKTPIPGKGGTTIADAAGKGQQGRDWLAWALDNYEPGEVRNAIEFYVRARMPDLWAEYETKRKGGGDNGDS